MVTCPFAVDVSGYPNSIRMMRDSIVSMNPIGRMDLLDDIEDLTVSFRSIVFLAHFRSVIHADSDDLLGQDRCFVNTLSA